MIQRLPRRTADTLLCILKEHFSKNFSLKEVEVMESEPFLLVELEDLSSIFTALKTTSRIKYTCFSVSNSYLIFGATSGGLYVFHREPCCFLHILPNKEGSVTQIAISPDEKFIAFATVKGLVCILEKSSHGAKNVVITSEHQNEQVTCLQWNDGSDELFIGDNSGKVSIVTVSLFPKKSMFQNPSFVLMQLESKIVQMDFSSNLLLVSTLTKCYICDTEKEIFRQVGHKLRDGEFGACIFNTQIKDEAVLDLSREETERNSEYSDLSHLKLLCARPGSRIWEVAVDGTVISTHHFKEALAVPPTKILFLKGSCQNYEVNCGIISNGTCEQNNSKLIEQSFNFQKLFIILPKFLLTYKSDGIYVFDPQKASVVLWNNEITNIVDLKCVRDVIYVWSGNGKMFALNLVSVEKFLIRLYFQKKYVELAKLCLEYESFLLGRAAGNSKLCVLHDLDEKLKSDELRDRLKQLINLYKETAQRRKNQNAQKLQPGIYLVTNYDQLLSEDQQSTYQKYLRPSCMNQKERSHSVSPERLQNGTLKHQGSCPSLVDLIQDDSSETPSEVVNGRKVKEAKSDYPNPETRIENVLEILAVIKKSKVFSNETILILLEEILLLSNYNKSESGHNSDLVYSFPFNVHFNKEDVKLITDLFHAVLKSKSFLEWLITLTDDWQSKAVKGFPKFLIQHISVQDLELDYKLSKILKVFSTILNENEIIELIKQSKMKCYYASLVTILDIFNDSSASSLNSVNITSTPKLLSRTYFLMSVGQIEQCSKYSRKIDLLDMLYLMLKFECSPNVPRKSSDLLLLQCHTMFLSYLNKTSNENKLIVKGNDIIELYVVDCLENAINAADRVGKYKCGCGFPSPCRQPIVTMFPTIGYALLDKNWPRNPENCLRICSRVPYLWKYLVFLRRHEPLLDLSPLLLQTGELQELENRSHEINEAILESYFKDLVVLKNGNCLNCSGKLEINEGTITWTDFGTLCIKILGPKETFKLYKKYSSDVNSKELEQVFFQSLIYSAIIERHSKGLRKNVVDLLIGKGIEDSRMSIFSEKLSEEIFGKCCFAKFSFQRKKFSSHHWGAKVNFKSNCAVCSLPLETKVLISESGLVVFKCAHVFHSACLRKTNLECPICTK